MICGRGYVVVIATSVLMWALPSALVAQSSTPPDPAQLIEALKNKGATRGLNPADDQEAQKRRAVIEALQKNEKTRGLSVSEHNSRPATPPLEASAVTIQDVQAVTADRPKSDLEVYFEYDSAAVTTKAEPVLNALGKSLTSDELKGQTFILAGHTDAKGSQDYNQGLSERRALAVKTYLVDRFNIPERQLAVIGYGAKKLKVADKPYADANRRVEVVNMGEVALAPSDQ